MNDQPREILEFPCDYGVKVIGRGDAGFESFVRETVSRHVPVEDLGEAQSRPSSGGVYLSVSVSFVLRSREQYEALCAELGADERVKVVL